MQLSAKTLLETRLFRVEELQRQTSSGVVTRQVVRHPGAVVIVPVVDAAHVCLIKNYRMAVNETLIELPAGTLEPGEAAATTARRELSEETGFLAGKLEPLHTFYLSPGILDERMHLFLAQELTAGEPAREPGEQIENLIVSWREALAMVQQGQIHDAKTMIGLLLGQQFVQ